MAQLSGINPIFTKCFEATDVQVVDTLTVAVTELDAITATVTELDAVTATVVELDVVECD